MAGAVLVGGASRRMGRDKATLPVDGTPMAARVAAALTEAGADPVLAIGGAEDGLVAGLNTTADRWPGLGPLGGVATALTAPATVAAEIVVVAPCDQPWLDAVTIRALIDALDAAPDAIGAAARTPDGRLQLLPGAWRRTLGPQVAARVEAGARRLDVMAMLGRIETVDLVDITGATPSALTDVDTPDDLQRPPA